MTLRARVVVNAAGVWAQRLAPGIRLLPSRGSHLVVRGDRLGSPSAALTVPLPGSRSRYVFALPQADGLVYLGLTDEPVDGPVPDDDPVPSDAEVRQLLDTVNQVLAEPLTPRRPGRRLRRAAAAGAARVGGDRARATRPPTSPASTCCSGTDRSSSVVGGKLTTYRAMAEETVDAVVARLGPGRAAVAHRAAAAGRGGAAAGAGPGRRAVAAGRPVRHGGAGGRGARVRRRWWPAGSETVGELRFAVRHEGARTVADLLDRRTRIGLVPADRARAVAVAEQVLAEEL